MLLVIIQRATVNVQASAFLYRQKLVRAPEVIREMDYNIKEFNKYVSDVLFNLRARGETAPDTLVHLFNAYKNAPDEDFVNYIKSKETLYEENEIDLDANLLMQFALTKYNTYVEQGTWNQLSRADEQIIALKAELHKLTNKTTPAKKTQSGKKYVSKSKENRDKKWAWLFEKKSGKEKIEFNGKVYSWCPYHKRYTVHSPQDCTLNPELKKKNRKDPEETVQVQGMVTTIEDYGNEFGDEMDDH